MTGIWSTLPLFVLLVAGRTATTLIGVSANTHADKTAIFDTSHEVLPVSVVWGDQEHLKSKYPEERAEKLIAELERLDLAKYLLIDQEAPNKTQNVTYENLCPSRRRRIYPLQVYYSVTKEYFWAVNPEAYKAQYFDIEECTWNDMNNDRSATCRKVDDAGPENTSRCIQEEVTRKILYMTKDEPPKIRIAATKVPVCCSCFVVSEF